MNRVEIMDYLSTNTKSECFGCEACAQICPKSAISILEDQEGFRYPRINTELCINCGLCHKICPANNIPEVSKEKKYAYGGHHKSKNVRRRSTSGGAFTAVAQAWCDENYVVYGAASKGLEVFHYGIDDIKKLAVICKSKYSQSRIGNTFSKIKDDLKSGKKVLFSGTPCQVAGLKAFLQNTDTTNLLLVEVICEGVPTPHYIRKLDDHIFSKYGSRIKKLDYRSKGYKKSIQSFKWDFQKMALELENGIILEKDRWFNPYWSIWLDHLMSRPSCYSCPFATTERQADISLGDLWGVHIYCPELYGGNGGASLIICNTEKGKKVWQAAQKNFCGHELDFDTALKYQGPMRKTIDKNPRREQCMHDLADENMSYKSICDKWAKKPSLKLLFQKYIWGNRQKVFCWNVLHNIKK
ncbi:Coenzyme F420 hydrogenase/dehydrogenase, beta subunit C-terminal domain [Ruminococcus flavefaciens]|uniref:Coenzyme F420 hydrogenase/dehydrogenase, beta subunit C-terminal domain n=1 Tax=Ruminococcus flavefaciens TaxID=1265 RepID=UPI0026F0AFB5|nr:Coenzyme F420 hydrogenase/dehydrogenase, beta subunit C-terminal domain [Ruminococcus flavefaciens]